MRRAKRLLRGGQLTREGVLVITAQRFREQESNRADARARLAEIIRQAATAQAGAPRHQGAQGQQAQTAGGQEAPRPDQAGPRQAAD